MGATIEQQTAFNASVNSRRVPPGDGPAVQ
jgi:hypothetical protein